MYGQKDMREFVTMQSLGMRQLFGYGVGDLGINLYFIATMTYLLYFYTDVYGLSPAAAGGVFLVARIVDALTDPIMGLLAERTKSRLGRYRPYIYYGAIPLALAAILTFTIPVFDELGKVIWAYLTYILFSLAYTIVAIPYAALTSVLTLDHHERTRLSSVRIGCAFVGGYIISVCMLPLVNLFETEAQGFQAAMIFFAIIATGFLWVTKQSTDERSFLLVHRKLPVSDSFKAVAMNPPLLIVILIFTCGMLSFTIRQSVTLYYLKYNVGREDLVPEYFAITMPIMILTIFFIPKLTLLVGKAGGIVIGALITILGSIGLYLTPYDNVVGIMVFSCITAMGGTPIAVLGWAMIPDTVEYAQSKLGVRAEGAIFSTASFFQKLAKAIGGAGVAAVLAIFGYVANMDQHDDVLNAIHGMLTLGPVVIMIIMIVAAIFYPLNQRVHNDLVNSLR